MYYRSYVPYLILMYILYITRPHKHFALKRLSCLNKGCDGDDDDDDNDDQTKGRKAPRYKQSSSFVQH